MKFLLNREEQYVFFIIHSTFPRFSRYFPFYFFFFSDMKTNMKTRVKTRNCRNEKLMVYVFINICF